MKVRPPTTMRLAIGVAFLGIAPVTAAQTYKYENAIEVFSAAHVSPESPRQVFRKVAEYCISAHPGSKETVTRGMEAWEARHAFALEYSARLRELLKSQSERGQTADSRESARRQLQEINEMLPEVVRAQSEAIIVPIRMAATVRVGASHRSAGEDMCRQFFEGLEAGSQDLKKNDPQLSAFFEERRQHLESLKKGLKKD